MVFLGSSSRFINDHKEAFADINNGAMPSVLQNDYQKDFVLEQRLRDQEIH
jgi:hypothetical protein